VEFSIQRIEIQSAPVRLFGSIQIADAFKPNPTSIVSFGSRAEGGLQSKYTGNYEDGTTHNDSVYSEDWFFP